MLEVDVESKTALPALVAAAARDERVPAKNGDRHVPNLTTLAASSTAGSAVTAQESETQLAGFK